MKTVRWGPTTMQVCNRCLYENEVALGTGLRMDELEFDPSLGETCEQCGAFQDARPSEPHYRPHLFSLSDAGRDVSVATGVGEVSAASAKLVGKFLANSAIIGGKIGWQVVKLLPDFTNNLEKAIAKKKEMDAKNQSEGK